MATEKVCMNLARFEKSALTPFPAVVEAAVRPSWVRRSRVPQPRERIKVADRVSGSDCSG